MRKDIPGNAIMAVVSVDKLEQLAIDRARELFGADHVNVLAYPGSTG